MTGPGGKNIARVSVRVVPDTSGFKSKVDKDLRGKEKPNDVKVTVDLDTKKAQAQLDKFASQSVTITANVDLDKGAAQAAVAALDAEKATITADVDVDKGAAEAVRVLESRKITIPAEIDIDAARAEMEKALISRPVHIRAIVDIDKNSFAPGILGATTLGKNLNKIQGEFKVLGQISKVVSTQMGQHFQSAGARIKSGLTRGTAGVDRNFSLLGSTAALTASAIGQTFVQVGSAVGKAFSGIASVAGSALGSVGSAFSAIGSKVAAVGPAVLEAVSGLALGAGQAVAFGAALFKMSAVATLVAEAGAGITAAWGFASTAIAAVPAAIALIGAPIAAIAIGMDGIKKAAASIKPEFDKLQKSVSATFEKGLTPVLKDLAQKVFPTLQTGLNAVAGSLVSAASKLESFISSGTGLALLGQVFNGVATEINNIGPGLQDLTEGFLRLAGNQHALDALGGTINELGKQIKEISNNPALNDAFDGLGKVLVSVTKGFGNLVNNGIKLFAAAAPGISQGLDDITSFFGKFNWEQLGTAVGNAFKGVGAALNEIPQSTIDNIGNSFEQLGAALNSQNFKDGVAGIAEAVPVIVDLGTKAVQVFGIAGRTIGGFVQLVKAVPEGLDRFRVGTAEVLHGVTGMNTALLKSNEAFDGFGNVVNVADGPLADFDADVQNATPNVANFAGGIQVFGQAIAASGGNLADFGLQLKDGVITPLDGFDPSVQAQKIQDFGDGVLAAGGDLSKFGLTLNDGVIVPMAKLPKVAAETVTAFKNNLAGLVTGAQIEANKIPPAILTPIEILKQKIPVPARAVGESFGGAMSGSLLAAFAEASSNVDKGFVPVVGATTTGTQGMVDAANAAIPGLGTAFQTGFANIQSLATAAFAALNTQFTTFGTAITALGTTFTTFGATIVTFGQNLTLVTNGFTLLGTGMTLLNASLITFGTSFTTINASLVTFNATMITLNAGLTLFGTELVLINASLLVFGTAFTTINANLLLFSQNLTLVNQAFVTLGTAFTTINQALLTFGQGLVTAGQAATTFGAAVQAAFQLASQAITTGMTEGVAAVTQGFVDMNTAATQFAADLNTTITQAMTDFVQAVTDGMTQVNDAIRTGMDAAVQTGMEGAAQFVSVGQAIDQGIADGITQNSGIVQDAVRKVVADAKAAADAAAKVNSPSRLFRDGTGAPIAEGIAVGILEGGRAIEDAARQSVRDAFAASRSELDTLGKLQLNAASISDFGGRVASQVSTAINAQAGIINLTVQSILDGQVLDERTQQALATWERQILAGAKAA